MTEAKFENENHVDEVKVVHLLTLKHQVKKLEEEYRMKREQFEMGLNRAIGILLTDIMHFSTYEIEEPILKLWAGPKAVTVKFHLEYNPEIHKRFNPTVGIGEYVEEITLNSDGFTIKFVSIPELRP